MKASVPIPSWYNPTFEQETKPFRTPYAAPKGPDRIARRHETPLASFIWDMLTPQPPLVQALLHERDQLRRERDHLRHENRELRDQLAQLHSGRQGAGTPPAELVSTNPYSSWIECNREVLAKYPDSFLAVDVKADKVVEHSKDQSELNRKLIELFKHDESARTRLFIIDTSLEF